MIGTLRVIGWTLLVSVVQGALVWAALVLALRLVPSAWVPLRHRLALAALLTVAFAFATTAGLMLTDWHQHVACWERAETPGALAPAGCRAHGVPADEVAQAAHPAKARAVLAWIPGKWIPTTPRWRAWARAGAGAAGVTGGLWLVASLLLVAAEIRARHTLGRLLRDARPLADRGTRRLVQSLVLELGVRTPVTVRVSPRIDTPCVAGRRRPVILLPVRLRETLHAGALRAVLAHELAHVRRHDARTMLLARAVRVLMCFNPFAAAIARRLRVEREAACDLVGVAHGSGSRTAYAELLLMLEGFRSTAVVRHPALPLLGERELMSRVRRLASAPVPRRGSQFSLAAVVLLAALAAGLVAQASLNVAALGSWAIMARDVQQRNQTQPSPVTRGALPSDVAR